MVEVADRDVVFSKRKAISALFPYAIYLEQCGDPRMVDVILCAARASYFGTFMWHPIQPYIDTLFNRKIVPSLSRVVALASPHATWDDMLDGPKAVVRWAAAVSVVPYTEEVGQSVVDALLQISSVDSLRPHVPIDIWEWLKRRPSLPPLSRGPQIGARARIVRHIRGFKDVEILTSYFLLIWLERSRLEQPFLREVQISIQQDFGGVEMQNHRKDLVEQLDRLQQKLYRRMDDLKPYDPKVLGITAYMRDCHKVKETLLEMDKEAVSTDTNLIHQLRC